MLTHKQTWMNVWLVLNLSNFIILFFGLPNSLSHFNAILGRKVRKLLESYDIFQVYSLNRLNALMSMTIWDMFSNTHTRMWHISWCFDHQERERSPWAWLRVDMWTLGMVQEACGWNIFLFGIIRWMGLICLPGLNEHMFIEWCVVRCGFKNWHQEDIYLKCLDYIRTIC